MKRTVHRLLAVVLCVSMLSCFAFAAPVGQSILIGNLSLSDTAQLQCGVLAGQDLLGESTAVRENVITYRQDGTVRPIVAYGSTLLGRSTMSQTAKFLTDNGLSLVAAVNGSFFDLNTGIPYGPVVTDGILRSGGNTQSIGFYADGSAVIGTPELKVSLLLQTGQQCEVFYNKALSQTNGIGLYSQDYNSTTKHAVSAYNVVLTPMNNTQYNNAFMIPYSAQTQGLRIGSTTQMTVQQIVPDSKDCTIPSGGYVLSIAANSTYADALANLKSLMVGSTVTVSVTADSRWQNVSYACGGGDLLVDNGRPCTEFSLDSALLPTARTAVGIKADGSLVLYTADVGTGSDGLTLSELAERMYDLDCITALNLDGGGSTAIGAQYPGYTSAATVNKPADGSLRACANFIYLVRPSVQTGYQAQKLHLYPFNAVLLPGTSVQMVTKATDAGYAAAPVPQVLSYQATGGTITQDGLFTAGNTAGTATISVAGDMAYGTTNVRIIDAPTTIYIHKVGSDGELDGGVLAGGSTTELTAEASYYGMALSSQATSYSWSVSGNIGTITADGKFTAAQTDRAIKGVIVASCGTVSETAEVTIAPSDVFADMSGHWAKDYVNVLNYLGVLNGAKGSDGKMRFRPDDSMTRQEFIAALVRFSGANADVYASAELPFADNDKIASWALNAVKAAYSLDIVGGSNKNGKLYLNPTAPISRQEAMVILARAQGLTASEDTSALDQFPDRGQVASWAEGALAVMVEKGIITGSKGKLKPLGNVKRGEVAKMLCAVNDL